MGRKRKKKKNVFDGFELGGYSIWEEKPNLDNTIADIIVYDELTYTPIIKIKKKRTRKALKETDEILEKKD